MKKVKYFMDRGMEFVIAFGLVTSSIVNIVCAAAIVSGNNVQFNTVAAKKETQ